MLIMCRAACPYLLQNHVGIQYYVYYVSVTEPRLEEVSYTTEVG
jgi:hypothetical protein